MNRKRKKKLKTLRSDCQVAFVGPIKKCLRPSVVPSVREVLQVLFWWKFEYKLQINDCITRVADMLMAMQFPGYEFKAKPYITREIRKAHSGLRSLQRNQTRKSETCLKQRFEFQKKLDKKFDMIRECSQEQDKAPRKRQFLESQAEALTNTPGISKPKSPRSNEHPHRKTNIVTPNVTAALTRTGTSNRNASIIFKALIQDHHLKEDSEQAYAINHNTIRLTRQARIKEMAKEIKDSFRPDVRLTVHWDGKLIPNNITQRKENRLPIIVTGEGVSKLLAVPTLSSGKAVVEAKAVADEIREWNLTKFLSAMVFDTTSSNTGVHGGVITLLPKLLGKKLLAFACRRHVAEVVFKHVFEILGDSSISDKLDKFKRFQNEFNAKRDAGDPMEPRTVLDFDELSHITSPWRQDTINFCLEQLAQNQPRGDYREFLELALIFLGYKTTKIAFRKAGSISRARWMSRALYVLKIWMLHPHFKHIDDFSEELMDHYQKLCIFICKIYLKYWFTLCNPNKAPSNDLRFWKAISNFDYPEYANTAAKSFNNHLWYLAPCNVALSFFDDDVSHEEKDAMVKAFEVKVSAAKVKTSKVTIKPTSVQSEDQLASFVTHETADFFEILQISNAFLKKPVETRADDESYNKAKRTVSALVVVNDIAERGCHMIAEFNNKETRDPQHQQFMLQVLEHHRSKHPQKW